MYISMCVRECHAQEKIQSGGLPALETEVSHLSTECMHVSADWPILHPFWPEHSSFFMPINSFLRLPVRVPVGSESCCGFGGL